MRLAGALWYIEAFQDWSVLLWVMGACWLLQCLGEPAIAEGNVVLINDSRLLVAEACSGLRIFVSILGLGHQSTAATATVGGVTPTALIEAALPRVRHD